MLKKCLAYLALSLLLVHADISAECPCKQKNQPRQQRQRKQRRQQQNVQQQAPMRKPAKGQPALTKGGIVSQLGEDDEEGIIIYNMVDKVPAAKTKPAPKQEPKPAATTPVTTPATAPVSTATPTPTPTPPAQAPAPAPVEDKVVYPTSPKELDKIVAQNALVIVNIGTEWCGPCKNFMPAYKKSAQDNPDIVHIKADADRLRGSKHIQDVNAFPTIKFFKHGKLQETCQGTSRFAGLCKSLGASLASTGTVPAK